MSLSLNFLSRKRKAIDGVSLVVLVVVVIVIFAFFGWFGLHL